MFAKQNNSSRDKRCEFFTKGRLLIFVFFFPFQEIKCCAFSIKSIMDEANDENIDSPRNQASRLLLSTLLCCSQKCFTQTVVKWTIHIVNCIFINNRTLTIIKTWILLLLHFQYRTSLTSKYNCVAYRIALPFKVQMAKTDKAQMLIYTL